MRALKVTGYLVSLGLLVATAGLYVYGQDVIDWAALRDYEPSARIARLAADASFSDEGRKLFYVHDPSLLDKVSFQGVCGDDEETIVLGCYITNSKIYVFDVEDERLEGVEEVTAAHEMLHAAFDRLSNGEKERITILLRDTYKSIDDERLQKTIASYESRDASSVSNELHSILGTEQRDLPNELEEYYEQYFKDRLVVVAMAESYESEFSEREEQIERYDEQLSALSNEIQQKRTDTELLKDAMSEESFQLESLRSNPQAYNAAVPSYNDKVRSYNLQLEILRDLVVRFNEIVRDRNDIATEERQLVEAIDTRATEL